MVDLHPETIATIRRDRPDLADIPDEVLPGLSLTQFVSLRLSVRDLGRAIKVAAIRDRERIRKALRR